jgi:hypothetical protein
LIGFLGILVISLLAAGCASGSKQQATASISGADVSVQQARQANAINDAPLDLRLAEDKLQQAKKASEDENYSDAYRLADEARADAQTAQAKSKAVQTARTEQQIERDVNALRREASTPPPGTGMNQ